MKLPHDQVREGFELMCHIDMTRYTFVNGRYVTKSAPHTPVERINTLYEGFQRCADWLVSIARVSS